jgi:DNA-binding HxlR family transcriptional regulator
MSSHQETLKFAIKSELLEKFKLEKAKEGDVLSRDWLYNEFMPSLSIKEEKALEETIREMINEGLIEYTGGVKATYRLTAKGVEVVSEITIPLKPVGEAWQ